MFSIIKYLVENNAQWQIKVYSRGLDAKASYLHKCLTNDYALWVKRIMRKMKHEPNKS